ncbi:hypothetical protein ACFYOD_06575 [Streptomyces sp. NPDC006703]|uniref:hypothetical protein n=1 Tax=Streptomyces sp. NPDC006703 TaxID=3364759 RepID=UPI0036C47A26
MGYDIYILNPDDTYAEGDDNYFRFAYTAMPRTLDTMHNFGMLVELPIPEAPSLEAYGLSVEQLKPDYRADTATAKRLAEYRAAGLALLRAAPSRPAGITSYKLRYNEGFVVTPAEITAALAAYEAHPHAAMTELPVGDQTWSRWVSFLRRASERGGFRTH